MTSFRPLALPRARLQTGLTAALALIPAACFLLLLPGRYLASAHSDVAYMTGLSVPSPASPASARLPASPALPLPRARRGTPALARQAAAGIDGEATPAVQQTAAPAAAASITTSAATSAAAADFAAAPRLDPVHLREMARNNEKSRVKSDRERIRDGEQVDRTIETRIATAAKKAVRPDCEKAFSGYGILGLIPLAASTVADVGCKWR